MIFPGQQIQCISWRNKLWSLCRKAVVLSVHWIGLKSTDIREEKKKTYSATLFEVFSILALQW